MAADGSIIIDTKINTDGIHAGENKLKSSMKKLEASINGLGEQSKASLQKQMLSLSRLADRYDQQARKVESLKQKLSELSKQKIETEEYKKIGSEIQKAETKLDSFYEKLRKLESQEGMVGKDAFENMQKEYEHKQLEVQNAKIAKDTVPKDNEYHDFLKIKYTKEYNEQKAELDDLEQRIIEVARTREQILNSVDYKDTESGIKRINEEIVTLRNNLEEMKNSRTAYIDPTTTKEYSAALEKYNNEAQNLEETNGRLYSSYNNLKEKVQECQSKNNGLANSFSNLHRATSNVGKGVKNSLKTILKYSLGIRSLFVLFNKLRSAIVTGFQNLAKYDLATQTGDVNNSISSLMSALTRLKNSFATAFAPILTTVAPILVRFINLISEAVTRVGMLVAALTGKDTFTKAIGVQENYAASLDKSSKSANKAKKATKGYLSSLDEIERYDDGKTDSGTGSGGGGYTAPSASEMFETVPIESSFKDLADEIKKIFSDIFKPFKEAWDKEGAKTIKSAKYALKSLGTLAESVGKSLLKVWTNGSGEKTLTTTLKIAQNLFNTIGNLAQAFKTAWEYAGTGTSIIQNIFNLGNSILGTIERITSATANWAKTLDFTPLLTSINTLLQALQPLTDNIGAGLEWFWNNVLLPIGSWTIQDAVPTFLQMLSSGITVVNSVIEALKPLGGWLWGNFLQPLGQWSGDLVITAMQTLTDLLDRFSAWIQNNQELVQNVTIVIGSFFAAFELHSIISGAVTAVTNFVGLITGGGGLLGALSSVVAALGGPVTIAIGAVIAAGVLLWQNWDTVKEAATKLKDWVVSKTIALKDGAVRAFNTLKTNAGNALTVLRDDVKQKWEAIKSKFSSFSTWLSDVFNKDWTKQFGIFGGTLNGFFKSAKDVIRDVKGVFKGLTTFISGTFAGNWSQAWKGIKTIFSNVFSGISDIAKTPLNAVIGGFNGIISVVNGLINNLNNLKFRITVPDWVPGVGGSWWGFNGFNISTMGTIPYLARGAVIPPRSEFLAVLGDQKNGRNLEAPEGVIREIIDDAFARHQQGGSSNFRFTAQLNRRTIFDEMIDEAKLRRDTSGNNPFELS